MYTSITRNNRGYNFQEDYRTIKDFWDKMKFRRDFDGNEVEWSKLFDCTSGDEVASYKRGREI